MDTDHQADKAWLLDTQRKLYTWSRANPDDAYRDIGLAWRRGSGRAREFRLLGKLIQDKRDKRGKRRANR